MAATFKKSSEWMGSIKGGYETAVKVAGKPDPQDGYLWRRRVYTVDRERICKGLLSFSHNVWNTASGDSLYVMNGEDRISGNADNDYLLLRDDVIPNPPGSGMWKEVQVAVSYTDWEQWLIPT